MTLKQRILNYCKSKNTSITLDELYDNFDSHKPTTVRARVYEQLGEGITQLGKGLYISEKAIVEQGDSLKIIDRLISNNEKYDFIFLDIPYEAKGQRSGKNGNRNLFPLDMISPGQFQTFIQKCELLLKEDTSPILFMITSGKSSMNERNMYLNAFNSTSLKRCNEKGSYTKLWQNGTRMNMGKHLMPKEEIFIYTRSGLLNNKNELELDFRLTPDFEYPTSKPQSMIDSIIEQLTIPAHWVLDPFAGSGKVLKSCLKMERFCHSIDKNDTSIRIQRNALLYQQLTLF